MNWPRCPVCDGQTAAVQIPKYNVFTCTECEEICQRLSDGTVKPLGALLEKAALGDDRVLGAMSRPEVTTVASFVDIFENSTRFLQYDLAAATGGLRTVLAQTENRLDFAISKLAAMELVSDDVGQAQVALREARSLVSSRSPRSNPQLQEEPDADDGDTSEPGHSE